MKSNPTLPRWITVLIVLCCLIEAALIIAPMLGYGAARSMVYILGGFWSVALTGGGVYPAQPYLMFLTYGLLHGGLMHLVMNMLSLAVVGRELSRFLGAWMMGLVYLLTQIAAAALFAVMVPPGEPMVGASGAIFGIAGALIAQAYKWRRNEGRPMKPMVRAVLITGALNIGITFLVPTIAWQAHLGGLIAGLILGLILPASRNSKGLQDQFGY